MSGAKRITRRGWLAAGLGGAAGAAAIASAARVGLIPPDYAGWAGIGETLTYASQRLLTAPFLTAEGSMAREFPRSAISEVAVVNGVLPSTDEFDRLLGTSFEGWALEVDGMVARPTRYSLPYLKRFPARSQITHMACEEGWSFIAEWTGIALADVLRDAGASEQARYVVYYSMDPEWWDSIDLDEARHPQTLLAYGLNGEDLPVGNGAPLRIRVPRQLGYKSVKHLARITVTDDLRSIGNGLGSVSPELGYSWYAGI